MRFSQDLDETVGKMNIKQRNLQTVFHLIQKYGPIERKQIQDLSDFSWGAVSQYTSALMRAGIVVQSHVLMGNVGKAPSTLEISSDDHYLVGVDLSPHSIRVLITDLKGNTLKSRVAAVLDVGKIVSLLLDTLEQTLSEYIGEKHILAISISAQGSTDEERGIALYLTFDPAWRNLNLRQVVEMHFGIRTFVFHDPDCVMIAEKYFGVWRDDYKNVIAVNVNYGVGLSLLCDSKLYTSTNRRSGELGHVVVAPDGALCSCGKHGCLEAYASKSGILNRYIEAANNGEASVGGIDDSFPFTYEAIKNSAENGDPLSCRLFLDAGRLLGQTCSSLVSIFDPDVIILYGEFINDRALYQKIMESAFFENLYPGSNTPLLYSQLGGSAMALGAAFLALDKILNGFLKEMTAAHREE